MSKNTPGPWSWTGHPGRSTLTAPGLSPHQGIVCYADYEGMWPGMDEPSDEANMALIAAAPELLEAARAGARYSNALNDLQNKGYSGRLVDGTQDLDDLFMDWHDKTHAAIAKAEGVTK